MRHIAGVSIVFWMRTGSDTTASVSSDHLCFVLCEGRQQDAVGVKLLLASLQRHAPNVDVLAYISEPLLSSDGDSFRALHSELELIEYRGPENWSCKPAVLLEALAARPGYRVVWIDVDILVAGDLSSLANVDRSTVIVAQESNPNDNARVALRHVALQIPIGSPRETTISSCVIGVTDAHRDLLLQWRELMQSEAFLAEQALPANRRKLFMGDQEVWEAALCNPANRDRAVHWLLNDSQMIQANYTTFRVSGPRAAKVHPMFIHATGNLKPWREVRQRFAQEMFPYFWNARAYGSQLSPSERAHFTQRSPIAFLWRHLFGGYESYRAVRRLAKRIRGGDFLPSLDKHPHPEIPTLRLDAHPATGRQQSEAA